MKLSHTFALAAATALAFAACEKKEASVDQKADDAKATTEQKATDARRAEADAADAVALEAKRLYEQTLAAYSDNDGAMNSIGVLYYNGNGVPRNTKLGRQWFEKAAALGNREAKLNLK